MSKWVISEEKQRLFFKSQLEMLKIKKHNNKKEGFFQKAYQKTECRIKDLGTYLKIKIILTTRKKQHV